MTEEIDNKEPGRSLARARQEKDLTMEEVAARLHLSAAQIKSLEENEYESLPEATYIKGYIRNYAQLLGIDSVTLIEAYLERENPKKNEAIEIDVASQQKKKAENESKVKYSILGIVILVIAVVGFWIGNQDVVEKNAIQTTIKSPANSDQNASSDLLGPRSGDQPEEELAVKSESVGDVEKTTNKEQEEQEPQYPAAPPKIKISNVPVTETTTTQEIEKKKEAVDVAPDIKDEKKEQQIRKEQVDELVLFFEQNSWADIRDTNDKKLLYKTITEGSVVSIKGVAPFRIFLGNADGVKVSYNGKQINFDHYKRGLIARFTVGRQ